VRNNALLVGPWFLTYYDHADLMGDFVTLFFYTLSRRPPSKSYPYGYGKFESLGTVSGIPELENILHFAKFVHTHTSQ
jgi:Cation efflux family